MVGLRWWNHVDESGQTQWVFESKEKEVKTNPTEFWLFWIPLVVCPLIWIIFGVVQFFQLAFHWAVLCVLAVVLNGANLGGYVKCAREARKKVKSMATSFVVKQTIENL